MSSAPSTARGALRRRDAPPGCGTSVPSVGKIWETGGRETWHFHRNGITLTEQEPVFAGGAIRIEAGTPTDDPPFDDIPGWTVLSSLDEFR